MAKQALLTGDAYLDLPRQVTIGIPSPTFNPPPPPPELGSWLLGLRLLKRVPIQYLVPDPRLLPMESMRLFHIEPRFLDRLLEGALSAGLAGEMDTQAARDLAYQVHGEVDALVTETTADPASTLRYEGLEPTPFWTSAEVQGQLTAIRGNPRRLTGLLLRSALVRNFPQVHPNAFTRVSYTPPGPGEAAPEVEDVPLPVLRRERLSADVLFVLFQGEPAFIQLHQPTAGTEFGCDGTPQNGMNVAWTTGPGMSPITVTVPPRDPGRGLHTAGWGVISIEGLKAGLTAQAGVQSPGSPQVAWALQQDPYHHRFEGGAQDVNLGSPSTGGTSTGGTSTGGTSTGGTSTGVGATTGALETEASVSEGEAAPGGAGDIGGGEAAPIKTTGKTSATLTRADGEIKR